MSHRIVTTRQDDELVEPGGWLGWLLQFRPFRDCADRIDDARHGLYSVETHGWRRIVETAFVILVTIPVRLVNALTEFWTANIRRFLIGLILLPMALMLANRFPLTAWAVFDWLDFTVVWANFWAAPPADPPGAVG